MINQKYLLLAIFMVIFISCPILINASEPLNTFTAFHTQTDELGMKHIRYNQSYNGIPIFGGQQIVHFDVNGAQKSISGKTVSDINIDTNPKISEQTAIHLAKKNWHEQFSSEIDEVRNSKLYVFNKEMVTNKKQDDLLIISSSTRRRFGREG